VIDQSVQLWQINRELTGITTYPFNRAQRLEFAAGWRNIAFDAKSRTTAYSLDTGRLIADETSHPVVPDSLNLATTGAALVYDTSVFGGVSPLRGQRYRLELGGSFGSLNYSNVLLDYRRYFRLRGPLTFAGRAIHAGRYGGDGNDLRLQDMFIGQPSLVRGYEPVSFSVNGCGDALDLNGACPIFDRLVGSKAAVANAELRMPLIGPLGIFSKTGFPPIEPAIFFDAGYVWPAQQSNIFGGDRKPVTSYGGTIRINLMGYAIGQVTFVHPNNRPLKNWLWELSLTPGF